MQKPDIRLVKTRNLVDVGVWESQSLGLKRQWKIRSAILKAPTQNCHDEALDVLVGSQKASIHIDIERPKSAWHLCLSPVTKNIDHGIHGSFLLQPPMDSGIPPKPNALQ